MYFLNNDPKLVEFTRAECRALQLAIQHNPQVIGKLRSLIAEKDIQIFRQILDRTERMKFIPGDAATLFYMSFARVEANRLRKLDQKNAEREFLDDLESVIRKLPVNEA